MFFVASRRFLFECQTRPGAARTSSSVRPLRTLATGTFLELNGVTVPEVQNDDVFDFVIGVAAGRDEIAEIAARLEQLVTRGAAPRSRRV